jgi:hypothetical protein
MFGRPIHANLNILVDSACTHRIPFVHRPSNREVCTSCTRHRNYNKCPPSRRGTTGDHRQIWLVLSPHDWFRLRGPSSTSVRERRSRSSKTEVVAVVVVIVPPPRRPPHPRRAPPPRHLSPPPPGHAQGRGGSTSREITLKRRRVSGSREVTIARCGCLRRGQCGAWPDGHQESLSPAGPVIVYLYQNPVVPKYSSNISFLVTVGRGQMLAKRYQGPSGLFDLPRSPDPFHPSLTLPPSRRSHSCSPPPPPPSPHPPQHRDDDDDDHHHHHKPCRDGLPRAVCTGRAGGGGGSTWRRGHLPPTPAR